MALVQDSVGVSRHSLLGRCVKVVRARIILVSWKEPVWVFLIPIEDKAFVAEVIELIEFKDGKSILDITDDYFSGLINSKVEITAPECNIKVVGEVSMTASNGKRFGQVEHRVDFGQILDPVLNIVLVGGQMAVDQKE